ncbi:bola protein [Lipomyces chichibuensis]|uniref:bola protein n=1 Tax=Lipomyces chichibuensis TaxID=1546026 RepID=UPI0033438F55
MLPRVQHKWFPTPGSLNFAAANVWRPFANQLPIIQPFGRTSTFATEAFNAEQDAPLNNYEKYLSSKLMDAFEPSKLSVRDISGGCGSMFAISIVSKSFKGVSMIQQHRMVNEVLADEIKEWHGVQLNTRAE